MVGHQIQCLGDDSGFILFPLFSSVIWPAKPEGLSFPLPFSEPLQKLPELKSAGFGVFLS